MDLLKFSVLSSSDDQGIDVHEVSILFNRNHIVSIKPIKMPYKGQTIQGYWLRTSNGKKYRATRIPDELEAQLGMELSSTLKVLSDKEILEETDFLN